MLGHRSRAGGDMPLSPRKGDLRIAPAGSVGTSYGAIGAGGPAVQPGQISGVPHAGDKPQLYIFRLHLNPLPSRREYEALRPSPIATLRPMGGVSTAYK